MSRADALFWAGFLDWHSRTIHVWDLALHFDATRMSIAGFQYELGEACLPAVQRMVEEIRKYLPLAY